MNEFMTIYQIVAIVLVVLAAGSDLATRRIPNVLTFGAAIAALFVHGYMAGWSGVGTSLAGWAVGFAFFFPFFALGGMGAGDVKLLAAVGAWLGPAAAVWVALYSSVAGGVMGLVVAAFSGYLKQAYTNLFGLLMFWRVAGIRPAPELMLSTQKGPRLAYAVPVLAGLMVTLWLR
jgi:prepilin peptidase CpaA